MMKLKMSGITFYCTGLNIIIIILSILNYNSFNTIVYLSLGQLIINIFFIFRKKSGNYIILGVIFLLLTYMFNFGQSLIKTFSISDPYAYKSAFNQVEYSDYIQSELFCMITLMFITVGYINGIYREETQNKFSENNSEIELKQISNIALFIFCLSFIPMLYMDYLKMTSYFTFGYNATYLSYETGIGKYLNLIAQFCKPAICVLIYANSHKKNLAKTIVIVSSLYYIALMFSGDRGSYVIYLLVNLYLYYHFIEKIKRRYFAVVFIVVYVLMGIITTIGLTRSGTFNMETLIKAYSWRRSDGIIYSVLREFGGSIITLSHSIHYVPQQSSFLYGSTYIIGFITILPKYPDFVNELFSNSLSFVGLFPKFAADISIIGGNYLGELYCNFGWLGTVMGYFIGKLLFYIDSELNVNKNKKKVAVFIVLMPLLLLWIRDYFTTMIFRTFWFAILIYKLRIKSTNR